MAVWSLVALLCLSAVSGEDTKVLYSLPKFSMVLQVKKSDDALIVFQDRLEGAVRDHLDTFFAHKLATPHFGYGSVEEVALSSRMTWHEKTSQDPKTERHYEVHADYESQILMELDKNIASSRLSQPIMDLLLIEAFEGDNYWALFHHFLSDTALAEIENAEVDVSADGFIENNNISTETQSNWTTPMKAGVGVAGFFCVALVVMWVYLCMFVKGTLLFREPIVHQGKDTAESATEEESSATASHDFGCSQEESTWMDEWARSITSIPERQHTKPKKKKQRRPARQHRSSLDQIEESSNSDEESWATSEGRENHGDHDMVEDLEDVGLNEHGSTTAQRTVVVSYKQNARIVEYEPSVLRSEGASC
jgi:hypothetical protein